MPVYIRTGELDIPAPSISSLGSDEEGDFYVLDPALVTDELPQPYRMIDKLLSNFLDDVWDKIVGRENKREAEARKIRPPVFHPSSTVDEFASISSVCNSEDNRYIFVAFQSGEVLAFDALTLCRIADWHAPESNSCFEYMTSVVIGVNIHLLSGIDDMGFAYLMIFVNDTFHFVQLLNEHSEGSPKSNATRLSFSKNGDFCGVALECEGSAWVEIIKIPRDTWLREIESVQKESSKRAQASTESILLTESMAGAITSAPSEMLDFKLSPIAVVLKVKSPTVLAGNNYSSLQEAVDKAGLPNTVGDGSGHLFNEQHLRMRRMVTKKLNDDIIDFYDPNVETFNIPTWHFLNPSRLQAETVITIPGLENIPVSVAIWWKNSYMIQIYPLIQAKASKDIELKPDIVWPMGGFLTCSAVSDCTNILAFGFEDGFLGVMDRHLCRQRAIVYLGYSVPITSVHILDGSLTNSLPNKSPPTLYCVVGLNNGAVVFVDCSSNAVCTTIIPPADSQSNQSVYISPLVGLPQVFLYSTGAGKTSLHETLTGDIICELDVPVSLEEPEKRFHVSNDGNILYVKNEDETMLSFHLQDAHVLERYHCVQADSQPLVIKETIEERCQKLLTQRFIQQPHRNEELASRWHNLSKELEILLKVKASMSRYTASPQSTWTPEQKSRSENH